MRGQRATGDPTDLEIGRARTELGSKNEDRGWGNFSSIPRRSSSRTGGGRRSLIRSTLGGFRDRGKCQNGISM